MKQFKPWRRPHGRRGTRHPSTVRDHEALADVALWALDLADQLAIDDPEERERVARVRRYVDGRMTGEAPPLPTNDIAFTAGLLCAAIERNGLLDDPNGPTDPGSAAPMFACQVPLSPIDTVAPRAPNPRVQLGSPVTIRTPLGPFAPAAVPLVVVMRRAAPGWSCAPAGLG